uniref:PKD_channel domain-containing protein n=1 Tax=Heterorhabditis bacteriophora TaxID=37862 RepID=A0A1I7WYC8_HETBA
MSTIIKLLVLHLKLFVYVTDAFKVFMDYEFYWFHISLYLGYMYICVYVTMLTVDIFWKLKIILNRLQVTKDETCKRSLDAALPPDSGERYEKAMAALRRLLSNNSIRDKMIEQQAESFKIVEAYLITWIVLLNESNMPTRHTLLTACMLLIEYYLAYHIYRVSSHESENPATTPDEEYSDIHSLKNFKLFSSIEKTLRFKSHFWILPNYQENELDVEGDKLIFEYYLKVVRIEFRDYKQLQKYGISDFDGIVQLKDLAGPDDRSPWKLTQFVFFGKEYGISGYLTVRAELDVYNICGKQRLSLSCFALGIISDPDGLVPLNTCSQHIIIELEDPCIPYEVSSLSEWTNICKNSTDVTVVRERDWQIQGGTQQKDNKYYSAETITSRQCFWSEDNGEIYDINNEMPSGRVSVGQIVVEQIFLLVLKIILCSVVISYEVLGLSSLEKTFKLTRLEAYCSKID